MTVAIPIRVMTVVIKKVALEEKYPGGVKRFQVDLPGPSDEHLVGVYYMSSGEVGGLLVMLKALGFHMPTCYAVGDVCLGPMDPCPGIEFFCLLPDAPFDKQWRAVATAEVVL